MNERLVKYLVIVLACLAGHSRAQFSFAWPSRTALPVTGNYGELRPNHFHTGIDFSTNNKVNIPLHVAAPGYVSRIRVSSVGYGKCVYVTHAGGYVTVYAHLNAFAPLIEAAVTAEMLKQKVNEIDFYLTDKSLVLEADAFIGLSGNSGGSTGPHIHFEVRDEKSELALNPLRLKKEQDVTRPIISKLAFYDLSDSLQPTLLRVQAVQGGTAQVTLNSGVIGCALVASDQLVKGGNTNNVYQVELYVDGKLHYAHSFDRLDFSAGRFVNEYADGKGANKFQKCFLPEFTPRQFEVYAVNRGRIIFRDSAPHLLHLKVWDEAGNMSETYCQVRTSGMSTYKAVKRKGTLVSCREPQVLTENGMTLKVPANTFYNSAAIWLSGMAPKLQVMPADLNMHAAAELGMARPSAWSADPSKLVLRSGSQVYVGQQRNDSVFFQIKNTGSFELVADTIAPKVESITNRNKLSTSIHLWKLSDNLSGIQSYNLYLGTEWVICEYDAKSSTLLYRLRDKDRGNLNFRLVAVDKCGNETVANTMVQRPK